MRLGQSKSFFNLQSKDVLIPEKDITPQKEIIQQTKSPIKFNKYDAQPTNKLKSNRAEAIERYKYLVKQFGKSDDEIEKELNGKKLNEIREKYEEYWDIATKHNAKIDEEVKQAKKSKKK